MSLSPNKPNWLASLEGQQAMLQRLIDALDGKERVPVAVAKAQQAMIPTLKALVVQSGLQRPPV